MTITVSKLKSFRSAVDPSVCYVHTLETIQPGDRIMLNETRYKVSRVVSKSKSKHWDGHTFYEVRLISFRS